MDAPTPELTIAVAQFAPTDDVTANLRTIETLARAAVARGAELVVVPEYSSFFTAELGQAFVDAAEPLDGPFVTGLAAIARDLGATIVAGMSERVDASDGADATHFRNTVVLVGPDGTLRAQYRKVHLYDAFGASESSWIEPGDPAQLPIVDVGGIRVGIETCYDLRFPEVTRRLAHAGADVVVLPAEWVRGPGKEHHWQTLLTARAIENTLYVAASGQTPPVGVGGSVVFDPSGVALAGLGAEQDVVLATVRRATIDAVRRVNPSLTLGRYAIADA